MSTNCNTPIPLCTVFWTQRRTLLTNQKQYISLSDTRTERRTKNGKLPHMQSWVDSIEWLKVNGLKIYHIQFGTGIHISTGNIQYFEKICVFSNYQWLQHLLLHCRSYKDYKNSQTGHRKTIWSCTITNSHFLHHKVMLKKKIMRIMMRRKTISSEKRNWRG